MKNASFPRAWVLVLLAASLLCTILASFLPYSIELFLSLAALLLAGAAAVEQIIEIVKR